jgi:hypothetical protein
MIILGQDIEDVVGPRLKLISDLTPPSGLPLDEAVVLPPQRRTTRDLPKGGIRYDLVLYRQQILGILKLPSPVQM